MSKVDITDNILYVGVNDRDIDLFEGQYVVPEGVSYNSYLIMDEKIALMDTVDARKSEEWLANIKVVLGTRQPDYLVVSHMEPDHAGSIAAAVEEFPDMKIVGNAKTFTFMGQFFGFEVDAKKVVVAEGDELTLGKHCLKFIMAPMVHWPEVMMSYETYEKILFSADGFGKFGALDAEEDWACEARRYYFNIVGKYGAQVQAVLKKLAGVDVSAICPLHGPVLKENLSYYIGLYNTWSSYTPEDEGVLVAYASIYGNTAGAAKKIAEMLKEKGVSKVAITDLARDDMAEAIEDAFRYDRMILACSTYDGGIFPCMEDFLMHLKAKNYQKRTVALIENGTWAPMAGKKMREILEGMKEIKILENTVTIRSSVKEDTIAALAALADEMANA
ncbi:MAG: FprA family A-type flavoprotein [Lachnospiraceae bacterium]|nr:FprA family A-type flavoprotein [Lachnospiraceae bacterium]